VQIHNIYEKKVEVGLLGLNYQDGKEDVDKRNENRTCRFQLHPPPILLLHVGLRLHMSNAYSVYHIFTCLMLYYHVK